MHFAIYGAWHARCSQQEKQADRPSAFYGGRFRNYYSLQSFGTGVRTQPPVRFSAPVSSCTAQPKCVGATIASHQETLTRLESSRVIRSRLCARTEEARFRDVDPKAAQQQGNHNPRDYFRGSVSRLFHMMKFLHTGHCIPPDFTARRGSKDVRNSTAVFAMCSFLSVFILACLGIQPAPQTNQDIPRNQSPAGKIPRPLPASIGSMVELSGTFWNLSAPASWQ